MSDGMTEMYREEEEVAKQRKINDITPAEWDAMAARGAQTQKLWDEYMTIKEEKVMQKIASDGSTASYYELPSGAAELQDLISYKNMNAQIGEIFRECYRYGQASHSDEIRGIKKILFYAQAELKRIEGK